MILVTGATGNIGGELISLLCRHGTGVRALVRSPERGDNLRGYDCEVAVGDFRDRRSLERALAGVDRVLLVSPAGPEQVEWESTAIEVMAAGSQPHVVKIA